MRAALGRPRGAAAAVTAFMRRHRCTQYRFVWSLVHPLPQPDSSLCLLLLQQHPRVSACPRHGLRMMAASGRGRLLPGVPGEHSHAQWRAHRAAMQHRRRPRRRRRARASRRVLTTRIRIDTAMQRCAVSCTRRRETCASSSRRSMAASVCSAVRGCRAPRSNSPPVCARTCKICASSPSPMVRS